jgi:hypothetical protein
MVLPGEQYKELIMPAKFTVSGSNTTISFEFTLPTTKMISIVDVIARQIWGDRDSDSVLYSSLTNQQKLDLLFTGVRDYFMTHLYRNASKIATNAARSDVNTNQAL